MAEENKPEGPTRSELLANIGATKNAIATLESKVTALESNQPGGMENQNAIVALQDGLNRLSESLEALRDELDEANKPKSRGAFFDMYLTDSTEDESEEVELTVEEEAEKMTGVTDE